MANPISYVLTGWRAGLRRDPFVMLLTLGLAVTAPLAAAPSDLRWLAVETLAQTTGLNLAWLADGSVGKSLKTALAGAQSSSPQPVATPSAPAQSPAVVEGPAKVVDTATMIVGGTRITLAGVRGVANAEMAEAMVKFIDSQGGRLRCEAKGRGYGCTLGGKYDLAIQVLKNGGGYALPDATEAQRQAEQTARDRKRGVWAQG